MKTLIELKKTACPDGFSLKQTLLSGQCFRWSEREDGFISGVAKGVPVAFRQREDFIEFTSGEEKAWREYLDLDSDYDLMRREIIAADPRLAVCAENCGQVRILRQEPFETFISFIISQNNNIHNIRKIVASLCAMCGEKAGDDYLFPTPEAIAALDESDLTAISCGYRAPYILQNARLVASGRLALDRFYALPLEQARKELTSLYGIGPKVADCVLLYGFHRLECFPKDVWIKRALAEGIVSPDIISSPYAGVAQQFVFEYIRGLK